METLHVMVREAVGQIPPQRLLRDEDREAIRRHQERARAGPRRGPVLPVAREC